MKSANFELDSELAQRTNIYDLVDKNGLVRSLLGHMINKVIQKEMDLHLGYEKHSTDGDRSGNSRNGISKKSVKTSYGPVEIEAPRDRNSTFEPQLVKKRQRNLRDLDEKIISMYASGMSVADIQELLKELYGHEFSSGRISEITNTVLEVADEWRSRPLESVYALVYFDAIHFKVKEDGCIITKAAYTVMGMTQDGRGDLLGIWIGEAESSKFWPQVCSELEQRGVENILIACMDDFEGLPDAIQSVFPKVRISSISFI